MSDGENAEDLASAEPKGLWLRSPGIGRDRLVRHLTEYLEGLGYSVRSSEEYLEARKVTRLEFSLTRPNPAVPSPLATLRIRVVSSGAGSLVYWDQPLGPLSGARPDLLRRFVEEMVAHLVRVVSTASRGAARVIPARPGSLPFDS